jgi:lipopolysaccharide export system permease protein
MKILDKYLTKQFLLTILFALIAFTLIFVILNMMENLDDFIDQKVSFGEIMHYYLVYTPDIIKLMTPVSVLFGALFTIGKASNLSELTAIKASGISVYRVMLPFLVTSFAISLFSIYFSGYVVPLANKTKINIERKYLKKDLAFTGGNIFFQDTNTRLVSISFFDNLNDQAYQVSIQNFDKNNLAHIVSRIDANRMEYDSLTYTWVAYNGVIRTFGDSVQTAKYFKVLTISDLHFNAKNLTIKQQQPEEMNITELKKTIESREKAGTDATNALIEYYSRFSFPMASIIVVIFALPISINKRRGGIAVQVGINILITFIYLAFMQISEAFGKNGAMNPFLTAWFANIVFLAGAIFSIPRIKQ